MGPDTIQLIFTSETTPENYKQRAASPLDCRDIKKLNLGPGCTRLTLPKWAEEEMLSDSLVERDRTKSDYNKSIKSILRILQETPSKTSSSWTSAKSLLEISVNRKLCA
jgi:hypothetical protein